MFDKKLQKRIEWLEAKVNELEGDIKGPWSLCSRVSEIERHTRPIIAEDDGRPQLPTVIIHWSEMPKPVEVTMTEAVQKIVDHLKLKFTKIDGTPMRVVLGKRSSR